MPSSPCSPLPRHLYDGSAAVASTAAVSAGVWVPVTLALASAGLGRNRDACQYSRFCCRELGGVASVYEPIAVLR